MAVSRWSTSVISALSSDTEPTLIITFDNAKYIFNAGENTGRTWIQNRANWRRVKALFFTQVGTQRMSGMPGLLMFMADGGISNLHLVGPQGLTHALAALRLYAYRQNMGVTPVEVPSISPPTGTVKPMPTYTDKNITVYSIPLFPRVDEDGSPVHSRSQADSSSKRKRRALSASPPRRNEDVGFSAETRDLPLAERMRLNGFLPTNLVGKDAEDWREMVVSGMFPARKPGSGMNSDAGVDADPPYVSTLRRHPGSFNPAGSDKQLPGMKFTKDSEPITSKQKPSLAYIILGPKTRGKLDAKKADELGLKGKLRGLVASGNTVTFATMDANGKRTERTVKPEECVGPGENPAVVIILDIPTVAHIPAVVSVFTESDFYAKFRSRKTEDRIELLTNVVYHLCGPNVIEDPRYQAFMRGFNSNVYHIVASKEHGPDPVTFTNAAFNQLQFNRLDPRLFPIPKFSLKAPRPLENLVDKFDFESGMGSAEPGLPPKTYVMTAGIHTGVRPILPPKVWESQEKFHPAATELSAIREAKMVKRPTGRSTPTQDDMVKTEADVREIEFEKTILSPAAFEKFEQARAAVKVTPVGAGTGVGPVSGVKVIPLGTSSALPSKYRNVSGYLIRIPKHGTILLEAGEGTWGQMCRFFGTDPNKRNNVWEVLRDIKVVFISHAHGDHHFGLSKILRMRTQLDPPPTEPLFLVALYSVILGLKEFSDIEDLGLDYSLRRSGVVPMHSFPLAHTQPEDTRGEHYQAMCRSLGLKALTTVEVRHRTPAFGVVVDHQDGWRIVFSGDTQPTEVLAEVGKNAKLLIHEATMADDQAELARVKAHSTVGQAIEIGRKMNAEKILLTHFSARYPKMPPQIVEENASPTTTTSPLTALFQSSPQPSSTSPISALPDIRTDSTTSPRSPVATGSELRPESGERKQKQPIIGLAFDHMNITLGEFWKLRTYLPAMDQAFGKDEKDEDEESERRAMDRMID